MTTNRAVPGLLALALAGCASMSTPNAPPPQTTRVAVPPATLPEAGVAYRSLESRAGIDVQSYDLTLDLLGLRDSTLSARAALRVRATAPLDTLRLDLVGMRVDEVTLDGRAVPYAYDGVELDLLPSRAIAAGKTVEVAVRYGGVPKEGLFFNDDARGEPTAFADNWPNRARWWFPSNDHPSDKATVRFKVLVPAGLDVIANGRLVSSGPAEGYADAIEYRWETTRAIPTYTMVVGVAHFPKAWLGEAACGRVERTGGNCAAVSVWPLAGDSAYAVERFRRAPDMLDFLSQTIGPFPYEKLAHVESSTRFGGMENSSAIFYARDPWEKGRMGESVIAHESVHQWFGDDVTEADWSHLWLSEGFASYFDPLYYESRDGEEAFRERMAQAKKSYMESAVVDYPIVHDTTSLYWLLNANNYPKGAWVLHMLRGMLGDDAFFRGVRRYYAEHAGGNALTDDLRAALEAESGADLGWFFRQWVYEPGYPKVRLIWSVTGTGADARLTLRFAQTQKAEWPTFRLPLHVRVTPSSGEPYTHDVELTERSQTFTFPVNSSITAVQPDPDGWILADWQVMQEAF